MGLFRMLLPRYVVPIRASYSQSEYAVMEGKKMRVKPG